MNLTECEEMKTFKTHYINTATNIKTRIQSLNVDQIKEKDGFDGSREKSNLTTSLKAHGVPDRKEIISNASHISR